MEFIFQIGTNLIKMPGIYVFIGSIVLYSVFQLFNLTIGGRN